MKITTNIAIYFIIAFLCFSGLSAQYRAKYIPTRMPDFKKIGRFADLQKKADAQDSNLDFFDLRMSYTRTSLYHPDDSLLIPLKRRMLSLFDVHEYKKAKLLGDTIIKKDYCDMFTHLGMSKIFRRLHEPKKAKKHEFIFNSLVQSILNSGDGTSPETAWMVISTQEEYFILQYLGYGFLSQTFITSEKGPVSIMNGGHGDKTKKFYFNISLLPVKVKKGK